ncbi:MAG: alpha-amylase family glycosyl hydrolase [Pseudomonadota bacterium]
MAARRIPTWPLLLTPLLGACASEDYAQLYAHQPVAPSLSLDDLTTFEHMGPELIDSGVNFCAYSENATRIELLLFDDPESSQPTQQYELTRYGDFWSIYVEGLGEGQAYGYVAWGPNWTYEDGFLPNSELGFHVDVNNQGDRFNPNKLLTDPWAKAFTRPHDWSRGSVASGPWRTESTYAGGTKSVIVSSEYTWSDNETLWQQARADGSLAGHDWNELIIYEVHPKGFTANTASGVEHPGTFRGFGEKANYLADLGITAVELLPVHQKEYSLGGYWGYSNLSYFAPEVSYSADYQATGEPTVVLDEFKGMVDALHQAGVEVILDVVYNHTGEGGLWEQKVYYGPGPEEYYTISWSEVASIFNLRGLDNSTYYVVSGDGQGFHDNTGVGHDVRANHPATRALILDSLRFYVEELHVDGFRFDLAAVLGQVDGSPDSWSPDSTVLRDIIDDPVLQAHNTRIIAEPWSMGSYQGYDFLQGSYPSATSKPGYAWSEWNDAFRDFWRRFMNAPGVGYDYPLSSGMYWNTIDGGGTLTGSSGFYGDKQPYNGINFLTVHDGYTMYDLFSFNEARNMCGPLNPVCCNDPYSVWCDLQEPWSQNEHDWGDETVKRQLMRDLFTVLLVSRGTPMLLGGDEWMRTQYGNNNAYSLEADNSANWFRWGEWVNSSNPRRARMHDFVRQLIAFRKQHEAAFAPSSWDGGMDLDWLNEYGSAKSDWSDRHLMMHYHGGDAGGEAPVLVLINGESYEISFTLPSGSWARVIDTGSWWDSSDGYFATTEGQAADPEVSANAMVDDPIPLTDGSYGVASQSIVVLEGM